MRNRRASVLMVVLWVLAILVVFAVGLGHRTAVFLSLAKYQRDRFAAFCLAKGALNLAIQELRADNTAGYDCPNDNWAINENKDNSAVSYAVTDEDRKINLVIRNPSDIRKLPELFKFMGLTENEAEELKNIFVDWIGPGNQKIKVPQELLVILEYFYQKNGEPEYRKKAQQAFSRFKDLATTYSEDSRLNVNTAPEEALAILAAAIAEDEAQKRSASALVSAILALRQAKNCFRDLDELDEAVDTNNQSQLRLWDGLKSNLKLTSSVFKIETTAKVKNVSRTITAIYERNSASIIGWHQNN